MTEGLRLSHLSRRRLLQSGGLAGLGLLAASLGACAQPSAPAPTTAAKPTTAPPPQPTAGAAAPTAKPAAATPAPAATQAPPKPQMLQKVRIATTTGVADFAFSFLGADYGIYEEEGIEPELVTMPDASLQMKAMLSGEVDIIGSGASLFQAQEEGAEVKLISGDYPKLNFAFFARPEIKSLKDLEGKSVGGGSPGALTNVIAQALLADKGVDRSNIQFVNVGSTAAIFQAIVAGKVDAGPSTADYLLLAEPNNLNVIADFSQDLPLFLRTGRVTSEKMIRDKPALVQAMVNANLRSHRYGLDHKEAFVKYTVEKMAKERPAMEFLWEYDYKNRMVSADGEVDPKAVEFSQQVNISVGAQKTILPFEKTTDLTFQKKFLEKYGPYHWK